MSMNLYWFQLGGCGGDTMSLLGAEDPNPLECMESLGIEVLWHPSLSTLTAGRHAVLLDRLASGRQELDILCVEGAVVRGPGGSGMYDTFNCKPKKDIVAALARCAAYVVAVGTCASYGGIGAGGAVEATGLQFSKWTKGGFLGERFTGRSGVPVVNLAGCPAQGEVILSVISALAGGRTLELDEYHRPLPWYGMLVHQGCTRNEYHEYRIEEKEFGEKGCLFFYKGCHGPLVYGPCNKLLWNRRSSKTRVGVPCFGCTRPDFPQEYPFFETRSIEGVPRELPNGVKRAHYMAYKGMAAAAAPERLKERKTEI
ncbi:MAG: NADH:ubiquinone oxidoreductase [Chitinivibrionia bacterium]|nr:NADH:ubiquinone oxidoreductase [Chitinivibrionia bacterium]